jgi:hypothetical protein
MYSDELLLAEKPELFQLPVIHGSRSVATGMKNVRPSGSAAAETPAAARAKPRSGRR